MQCKLHKVLKVMCSFCSNHDKECCKELQGRHFLESDLVHVSGVNELAGMPDISKCTTRNTLGTVYRGSLTTSVRHFLSTTVLDIN